jgi:hypothetical protein
MNRMYQSYVSMIRNPVGSGKTRSRCVFNDLRELPAIEDSLTMD